MSEHIVLLRGAELEARHAVPSPTVLRASAELHATVHLNSYPGEESRLFSAFLADLPRSEQGTSIDPWRSPGDRCTVIERDVCLYPANGAAKTKLTNDSMDRRPKTISTTRSWHTVPGQRAMLVELAT